MWTELDTDQSVLLCVVKILLVIIASSGSGVERIDALHFLAGCRKRQLNQALFVLCLSKLA